MPKPDPNTFDAEFRVVSAANNPTGGNATRSNFNLGIAYLGCGLVLGGITSLVVFVGGWIYCVATYGFLLGGSLGWIPAGIAATISAVVVRFLWGPLALVALVTFLNANSQNSTAPVPTSTVPPAYLPTAPPPTATTDLMLPSLPTAPPAAPLAPPPPSSTSVNRAIDDFRHTYGTGGMAGAVTSAMDCYGKLSAGATWSDWDYCAAFDQLGSEMSAQLAQQYGPAARAEYFDTTAVQRRQNGSASAIRDDYNGNRDRVAALGTILDQAIATKASQAAVTSAAIESASAALEIPASASPSFDCSLARSETLKLVCSTPALAQADREMAAAYRDAIGHSAATAVLRESQREWVRRRNNSKADVALLAAMYADRTAQLRQAPSPN